MTSTALQAYTPTTIEEYKTLGDIITQSKMFPDATDQAKAIIRVMAGAELGFPAIYSLTKIYMVKGKIAIGYEAMGAKVKSSGRYDYKVKEWTNTKCVLDWYDNGEITLTNEFTYEEAKQAGIVQPGGNWEKWRKAMLFSKVLSQGARVVCPHVIGGSYTLEDFGYSSDEGVITIEGKVEPAETPLEPEEPEVAPVTSAEYLDNLKWLGFSEMPDILKLLGMKTAGEVTAKYGTREGVLDAVAEKVNKDWRKRVDLGTGELDIEVTEEIEFVEQPSESDPRPTLPAKPLTKTQAQSILVKMGEDWDTLKVLDMDVDDKMFKTWEDRLDAINEATKTPETPNGKDWREYR